LLSTCTSRLRTFTPPPHTSVQSPKVPHDDTTQLIGHGCVLQLSVSSSTGHAAPPKAPCTRWLRVRCLVPLPHVFEQSL
jgi:hypothetical protein